MNEGDELEVQLRHSRATHRMARVITHDFDAATIHEAMAKIIGETLDADRTLIYDISFEEEVAVGLCEWLNPLATGIEPTLATYPLSVFRSSAELVKRDQSRLESHVDDVHPALVSDGSAELLHRDMKIQSLLWFPFDLEPQRMSVLVFNQVRHRRNWSATDLSFVEGVAELVSMAQLRIRLETQRRERDQENEKRQRLESLGLLAGGVAHDFNNLLTTILGHASIMRRRAGVDLLPMIEEIAHAGEAAAALCRQLLTYSGSAVVDEELVDVNVLVTDTLRLAPTHAAQVELQLTVDPLFVDADRSMIQQVVLNLLVNAAEALEDDVTGGITVISGRMTAAEARLLGVPFASAIPSGKLPFIQVRDCGAGMDPETAARMFEPFFTTKRSGHGLGLATVHGILNRHGAEIGVRSELGRGTKVTVVFPPAARADEHPSEPPTGLEAQRRVLVVDDEQMVRNVCKSVLALEGYDVLTASNGAEALDIFGKGEVFDALVLDVGMRGMDGRQTFEALRVQGHHVPVVMISAHPLGPTFTDAGFDAWTYLAKPFRPDELLATVGSMIVDTPPSQ